MTIVGIDTVAVVVSDRRRALQWFMEVLSLPVAYIGPTEPSSSCVQGSPDNPGHWIELGPRRPMTRIHLCELKDHSVTPGHTGITLLTDNIQGEYERLRARGVQFTSSPKQMEWGEWLCEFRDPDGNEFDLKQPLQPEKWTVR